MKRQRGMLLMELVIGLFVCSLLLLAAGKVMQESVVAEQKMEQRWRVLLACRTVLELSCVSGAVIDTQFVCTDETVRAWSTVDRLSTGELIVRANAACTQHNRYEVELARLVWPGASDLLQEIEKP